MVSAKPNLCYVCKKNDAFNDPTYGILPCNDCRSKESNLRRPGKLPEFTSESIKEQRKEYDKDIVQPFRKGQLSKEYVETYGVGHLEGVTEEEAKNAKYVWDDEHYYNS